jgi:hypothetical protein
LRFRRMGAGQRVQDGTVLCAFGIVRGDLVRLSCPFKPVLHRILVPRFMCTCPFRYDGQVCGYASRSRRSCIPPRMERGLANGCQREQRQHGQSTSCPFSFPIALAFTLPHHFALTPFLRTQIWDLKTYKLKNDLPGHTDEVYCVDFVADKVVSGGRDRTIKM